MASNLNPRETWARDATPEQLAWIASLPRMAGFLDADDQPDYIARIDEVARYSPKQIRDWWTTGDAQDRRLVDHLLDEQRRELADWQREMFQFR